MDGREPRSDSAEFLTLAFSPEVFIRTQRALARDPVIDNGSWVAVNLNTALPGSVDSTIGDVGDLRNPFADVVAGRIEFTPLENGIEYAEIRRRIGATAGRSATRVIAGKNHFEIEAPDYDAQVVAWVCEFIEATYAFHSVFTEI